ncbi:hypothetical protein [Paucidesulfovibrio longus]|uniref:hypothetical protein n=1 Tax=Paucidesulfovibrio longus TaxID=889 RepID=UPI0003B6281B|nr:hypothetical protein [Paucidesulfovibrio longus]
MGRGKTGASDGAQAGASVHCGFCLGGLLAWAAVAAPPACADAGGPLLTAVFLDAALFSWGEFAAVLVEWIYLRIWIKGISTGRALWWSVLINSLSALLGMLLLLALLPLFPEMLSDRPDMHETSLHMWLTLGLVLSWLVSVGSERWLLGLLARRRGLALRHPWRNSMCFNALSYVGLSGMAVWLLYIL